MKIGILNSLYERGGAEVIMQSMARDYINQGHEVFLIVTKGRKDNKGGDVNNLSKDEKAQMGDNENQNETWRKPKIYYLNSLFSGLNKYPYLVRLGWHLINLFNLHKYYQIKKILKTEKPDLVITHNLMGLGYLTPGLLNKLRIKHEHYLHDIQLLHPSGLMFYGQEGIISSPGAKIYQSKTRFLFRNVKKVTSPSKWLMDLYLERGFFKKAEKIIKATREIKEGQNRLSKDDKQENSDEYENNSQTKNYKKFLYVGQVEESKGVSFLIKTWLEAKSKAELVIVGTGQALDACKKIAEESGADDANHIKFLGQVDNKEVKKLMTEANYLIVPSLVYENSPTVIYEALENGLAIIASRIGGIPELIGPSEARNRLFTPGNSKELTSIIKNVI